MLNWRRTPIFGQIGSDRVKSWGERSLDRLMQATIKGATEIAGVDNVARAKKQGLKTREWTRRHEKTGVDNA